MILTTKQLKEKYINYKDSLGKIHRDIKCGKIIPIIKGLYETNSNIEGYKLSSFIYGPSYLSFDFALYYYDLIPETIYNTFTCATYNKKKIKHYSNKFGTYIYRDAPKNVFSLNVNIIVDNEYSYLIATKEKALCDKLYIISPIKSVKELKSLLFDDLRIDLDKFNSLNKKELLSLAALYHSTNLNFLIKFLKGEFYEQIN